MLRTLTAVQTFAVRHSPFRSHVAIPGVPHRAAAGALAWRAVRCAALASVAAVGLLFAQRDHMVGLTVCVPGTPLLASGANPFSRLSPDMRLVVQAHEARHASWIRDNGCAAAYRTRLFGTAEQRATLEIDAGCAELPYYMVGGRMPRAAAESVLVRSLVSTYDSMQRIGFHETLALTRRRCRS